MHTCPHCQRPTLLIVIPGIDPTVHCGNRDCGGWLATMTLSQFTAMTADELESRKCGRRSDETLDDAQAEFEKRVREIEEAAKKRAECRARGECVYG